MIKTLLSSSSSRRRALSSPTLLQLLSLSLSLFLLLSLVTCHQPVGVKSKAIASSSSSFAWQASIDRTTGVASSTETSLIRVDRFTTANDGTVASSIQKTTLHQTSKDLVASWAEFLCKGRITFGLLQAKRDNSSDHTTSICFRGIPNFSILTFGPIQQRQRQQQQPDSWAIPILPDACWLALPKPNQQNSKNDCHCGCLTFQIKTQQLRHSPKDSDSLIWLESHIEGYRPWLAGHPPISRFRKALYLNTQSRIHAYIIKRFHDAWRHAILTDCYQ